jgi:hypothetical protein
MTDVLLGRRRVDSLVGTSVSAQYTVSTIRAEVRCCDMHIYI